MRVAYVCCDPGVPVFGSKGCSIHVQEIVREFLRRDCTVDLIAPRAGGNPAPDLSSVCYHPIPAVGSADPGDREQVQIESNEHVLKRLTDLGPFDLVYERYSLYAYAGMQYARSSGTPGVLEVNSPLIREQAQYRQLTDRETAEEMTWQAIANAGAVIAVSDQVADYARSYRGAADPVHVIPNGVHVGRFAECASIRKQSFGQAPTFGFVGTLKPWHGVADLIGAYQRVTSIRSDARLLIVGDGPERARLERQVARLPNAATPQVQFTGAVASEQIPALLAQMDVAVAPYGPLTDFYFSPLKIYEYMAAELPTVASRVGQLPKIIQENVTGMFYEAGNITELSNLLLQLIDQPQRRARLGLAAKHRVAEHSTWESVVDKVFSIAAALSRVGTVVPKPQVRLAEKKSHKNLATKS